jgi:hypothetical protein
MNLGLPIVVLQRAEVAKRRTCESACGWNARRELLAAIGTQWPVNWGILKIRRELNAVVGCVEAWVIEDVEGLHVIP